MRVALNSSSGVFPGVPRGYSKQILVGVAGVLIWRGERFSRSLLPGVLPRSSRSADFDRGIDVTRGCTRQRVQPLTESMLMLGVSTTTIPARQGKGVIRIG